MNNIQVSVNTLSNMFIRMTENNYVAGEIRERIPPEQKRIKNV